MASIAPHQTTLSDGRSVTIRAAARDDAEASYALRRMDYPGKITLLHEYTDSLEVYRDKLIEAVDDPARLWLVSEAEGVVIGQIVLQPTSDDRERLRHVCWFGMALRPEWRGLGLGTILLSRVIEWCEVSERYEKLTLGVLSNNPQATLFYAKHGFIEEGRKKREVKLESGEYLDDILMYRWVASGETLMREEPRHV